MEKQEGYRIVELHVSNIKRIKTVDITPEKDIVIIEGDNAQGKTSVMDSIAYLLGGKRLIPEQPIRKGEAQGFARAVIGDFEISRVWTNPYTSYLKIKTKDSMVPKNPQTFLNERIGSFSLEVAELMNMDKDERIEVFKRITGLNLDDLVEKQKRAMDLRYDEKKMLTRLQGELKNYADLPEMEQGLDFDELQKERKQKETANEVYRGVETGIARLVDGKETMEAGIGDAELQIAELQKRIDELKETNQRITIGIAETEEKIAFDQEKLESMEEWDLSEIDGKIKRSMDMKELQFKYNRKEEINKDLVDVSKKINKYSIDLGRISDARTQRIKDSAVPVEGVEFDGESIRYKGIEFEECSTAERIEMSIAIGIKENPQIRILLIRDGSAIGKATMERIKELAKKNQFQIWIERVTDVKGSEIYIEDGEVK